MTEQVATGISNDAKALMAFEAGKKSMGITYVLWLLLGGLGVHRFYMGKIGSGVAILVINILGWLTIIAGIGFLFLAIVGVWLIVDAFLIPGWIRTHNTMLMAKLSGGGSPLAVAATL